MEGADAELAQVLLENARAPNLMQARVEAENLRAKNAQRWVRLDATQIPDFPQLTLEFLRNITIGVYQIKL